MTIWASFNEQICCIKKKKGSQAGNHLKLTREMISRHRYKVKTVTSFCFAALSFSMNHFILSVCTLLLCPSNTSGRTGVIAPWQERFLIPINHSYGDTGFLLTWLHPPSLLPFISGLPPCFTVIVINNIQCSAPFVRAQISWLASYRGWTRNTVHWVIYWPCWASDRLFLC